MNTDAHKAADLIERIARLMQAEEQKGHLNPAQWEALRYLAKANSFSRTPAALAEYLGSTRGTVSQTLIALEKKECIKRTPSARDKRSVDIALTPTGQQKLVNDPRQKLASCIEATRNGLSLQDALSQVLNEAILRNKGKSFGICASCRFFLRTDKPGNAAMPNRCGLLNVPLSDKDSEKICVEHEK
ncbi:MAG: MarR family transcriptional regulator [Thalassospira sp.]|uniref:MarR family winged helix-turn-helix transcriptional regulator n=1 Tax=Thalassospira sp. GB04J01 TaxID=1485225 RepID=UPI000C11F768|nr:MarR family transcriptional regulator [Thalassospira sp. GB04J01]MBV17596.1 MarR family transcriptional regulator [Thalassospira sp.]|tara:strand:+ start:55244 stop:55804 length:561 start_codon:yes stop_codon:yes gene_type:complete